MSSGFRFEAVRDRGEEALREESGRSAVNSIYLSLAKFFYPAYRYLSANDEEFIREFDRKLMEANFSTTPQLYLSASFGIGAIVGAFVGLIALIFAYLYLITGEVVLPSVRESWVPFLPWDFVMALSPLKYPALVLTIGALGAGIGLVFGGSLATMVPRYKARERDRQIGLVFPDAVAAMATLAQSGSDQLSVFRDVADSGDTYGELAIEFQRIIRPIELFNENYETAVRDVAETTPNDDLETFLSDMLAIMNSGGDFRSFLEEVEEQTTRDRRRAQEGRLEWLEMLGQGYVSLQILPMLIVIVLVIMSMVGSPRVLFLYLTVYVLQPFLNLGFGILISTIKIDEPGDGLMEIDGEKPTGGGKTATVSLGAINDFVDRGPLFKDIRTKEAKHKAATILRHPLTFLQYHPDYLFLVTVPAAVLAMTVLLGSGRLEPSWQAMVADPVTQTFGWFFIPFYVIGLPYAILHRWTQKTRSGITDDLDVDLRKLANTNETGQPLHESMRIVAETSDSRFSDELGVIYKKLKLGITLDRALVEFNNDYHIPRLARTIKIIEKSQEVSSEITATLKRAANAAGMQKELIKERYARTAQQVGIIEMSFLVFLAIIAGMDFYLIERISSIIGSDPAWPNFESVNQNVLKLIFFHSALMQGVTSGIIAGYVQTADIRDGLKYSLVNGTLALIAWLVILYVV